MRAWQTIGLGVALLALVLLLLRRSPDVEVPVVRQDGVASSRISPEALESSAPRPQRIEAAPAAGPPRTILVEVTSREWAQADAALVPGVAVVVGVGWTEGGSRAEHLVPGEYPDVGEVKDRTALAALETDASGEANVALEVPAALLEAERVWVEVVEPGHQRRVHAGDASASPVRLAALTQAGWTLRGRAVDTSGEPAPGGRVYLRGSFDGGATSKLVTTSVARDGTFAFQRGGPGGTFEVLARSDQLGVDVRREVRIDPHEGPVELELVLRGEGVIAGVLVDPAGRPLAGRTIRARCVDESRKEWDGGLVSTSVRTDAAGAFVLSGLLAGEAELRLRSAHGDDVPLSDRLIATGARDLRLVAPQSVLSLRVHETGTDRAIPFLPAFVGRWPETADWVVVDIDDSTPDREQLDGGPAEIGPWITQPDGRVEVVVPSGRRYRVGACSHRHGLVEREIVVASGDWLIPVDLELPLGREPGRLVVEVQDARGDPVADANIQVRVMDARSGRQLFATGRYAREPRVEVLLPAGTYRVVADAPPGRGMHGGRLGTERFLPTETVLAVTAGEVTRWAARLEEGGRLRVTARLEQEVQDTAWAEVTARPAAGGTPRRPLFAIGRIVSLPDAEEPRVRIGHPSTQLDVLSPGRWIVRVERDGFLPAEVLVEIVGGEITPVEAMLARE